MVKKREGAKLNYLPAPKKPKKKLTMVAIIKRFAFLSVLLLFALSACAQKQNAWLQFMPRNNSNNGKHIVLISGDEEYRSEESLPMLAKILTDHHGFKTTVLFAINPETGFVDPAFTSNIPGMESLSSADLIIIATRFRELPNHQMKLIDDYLRAGKPVIGFRTATHAFNYAEGSKSAYIRYGYSSKEEGWEGGFGRKILGETWISHHGKHGIEGTRGIIDGMQKGKKHPILKGVKDVWGPTDVYTISDLLPEAEVLLWGQSTIGMTADSPGSWEISLMPVAWTKRYKIEGGKEGKVFTTTMGSAIDFLSEDLRRLIVNASYWALDMEQSSGKNKVDIIGTYQPTMFGFGTFKKDKFPIYFVN